jgi:hypothetical protein
MTRDKDGVGSTSSLRRLASEAYRAALYINNSGVALLQQGHFDSACETLKDSLVVMKYVLHQEDSSSAQQQQQQQQNHDHLSRVLQQKLQAVRSRLVQAQKQPLLKHPFQIQPCDDGDIMAVKTTLLLAQKTSSVVFVAIRLGSSHASTFEDSFDSGSKEGMGKIPAAVILYNHALAHILAYHQHQHQQQDPLNKTTTTATIVEDERQRALLHGGFVCLIASHNVLCQYRAAQRHGISLETLHAMVISARVLHHLFHIFTMQHQTASADECWQTLSTLLEQVQLLQDALGAMNVYVENHTTARAA